LAFGRVRVLKNARRGGYRETWKPNVWVEFQIW